MPASFVCIASRPTSAPPPLLLLPYGRYDPLRPFLKGGAHAPTGAAKYDMVASLVQAGAQQGAEQQHAAASAEAPGRQYDLVYDLLQGMTKSGEY